MSEKIDAALKKELLDLLLYISYAYEDGNFWKEWSTMKKFLSNLPEETPAPTIESGTVIV